MIPGGYRRVAREMPNRDLSNEIRNPKPGCLLRIAELDCAPELAEVEALLTAVLRDEGVTVWPLSDPRKRIVFRPCA